MDAIVSQRLKEARHQRRMTGGQLCKQVGISAQQLSKIERNLNRIHAGQLWLFAQILGQSVDWFFELPEQGCRDSYSVRKAREFFAILEKLEPAQLQLIANTAKLLADKDGLKPKSMRGSRRRLHSFDPITPPAS
jgi:transcriptional regulator with XRE-family HTH domain